MSEDDELNYDFDINNITQSLHKNFIQNYKYSEQIDYNKLIKDLPFYIKCQRFNNINPFGISFIEEYTMNIDEDNIKVFLKYFKINELSIFIKYREIKKINMYYGEILLDICNNILDVCAKTIYFNCTHYIYPIQVISTFIKLTKISEIIFDGEFCEKYNRFNNFQILESIENNKNIKKIGFLDDSYGIDFIEKLFSIKSLKSLHLHSLSGYQIMRIIHILSNNKTLKEIKIDQCIDDYAFKHLIKKMIQNKHLRYLSIASNIIFEIEILELISEMLDINKSLHIILINTNAQSEYIEYLKDINEYDEYKTLYNEVKQKLKNNRQLFADVKKSKKEELINFAIYLPRSFYYDEFIEFYKNVPINVYD